MTFTLKRKATSTAAPLRSIRVEHELWAAIHAAAKARGLTASAYLRLLASEDIELATAVTDSALHGRGVVRP